MLPLDSELMDIADDEEEGHHTSLAGIGLEHCANDDECQDKTRFVKDEIHLIVEAMGLPPHVHLCCHQQNHHKFNIEEPLVHMLQKMTAGRTQKDSTCEFGGCSTRWGRGHSWFAECIDNCFEPLMGQAGMVHWVKDFPVFAEKICHCVMRGKQREMSVGAVHWTARHFFN